MESASVSFLENTLGKMSLRYYLIDASGKCLLPKQSEGSFFSAVEKIGGAAEFKAVGDLLYFAVDSLPRMYLALEDTGSQGINAGLMACAYIKTAMAAIGKAMDKTEFYRQILLGRLDRQDIMSFLTQFSIDEEKERSCIVLRDKNGIAGFTDTLDEVFPSGSAEVILEMDRNTICVVLCKNSDIAAADSAELAAAIEDTARDMGFKNLLIGMGDMRRALDKLSESYREGLKAIELGVTYAVKGSVFIYKSMLIERLLNDMPEDICRQCYQMIFNKRNSRLLNEEMQHTIRVFMDYDLNLSEAARYIYVHRNTLVYRLDKLQAATGLDLRNFDDAATFKLIMLLGNRIGVAPKNDSKNE